MNFLILTSIFFLPILTRTFGWNRNEGTRWYQRFSRYRFNSYIEDHNFAIYQPLTSTPRYEIGGNTVITNNNIELSTGSTKTPSFSFLISESKFTPSKSFKIAFSLDLSRGHDRVPPGTFFSVLITSKTNSNSIFNTLITTKSNLPSITPKVSELVSQSNFLQAYKLVFGDISINRASLLIKIAYIFNGINFDSYLLTVKQKEGSSKTPSTYEVTSLGKVDRWDLRSAEISFDFESNELQLGTLSNPKKHFSANLDSNSILQELKNSKNEQLQITLVNYQEPHKPNLSYSYESNLNSPLTVRKKVMLNNFALLIHSKTVSETLEKNTASKLTPLIDRMNTEKHILYYGFKLFLLVFYHMGSIAIYLTFMVYLVKYKNYGNKKTLDPIEAEKLNLKKNRVLKTDAIWHCGLSFFVVFFSGLNLASKINIAMLIIRAVMIYRKNYFTKVENEEIKEGNGSERVEIEGRGKIDVQKVVSALLCGYGLQCGVGVYLLVRGIMTLV